jgi:predicted GTPase
VFVCAKRHHVFFRSETHALTTRIQDSTKPIRRTAKRCGWHICKYRTRYINACRDTTAVTRQKVRDENENRVADTDHPRVVSFMEHAKVVLQIFIIFYYALKIIVNILFIKR